MYTCAAEIINFSLVCVLCSFIQLRIQELEAELKQKNVAPPTQEPKNVVPQTQEAKNVVPQAKNGVPQTQEAKKLPVR